MSKRDNKFQNKKISEIEALDTLQSSDDMISKDILDTPNKTERKNINKNQFIYYTPISKEKIKCYFPSTPKKLKENKEEDESDIKGKNLLFIFESM